MSKFQILNLTTDSISTLENLTDLETTTVRGGFLPLIIGAGVGAAGGAIGQGLGNLATGQPLQKNVLESAALGGGLGLLGPIGATTKAISVAAPFVAGARTAIPASAVARPFAQGALGGLANSLTNK